MVNQETFKAAIEYVKNNIQTLIQNVQINYSNITNKPSINGVTLDGNKTSEDLHIGSGGVDIKIQGTKVIFSKVASGGITDIIITGTKVKFVKGGS